MSTRPTNDDVNQSLASLREAADGALERFTPEIGKAKKRDLASESVDQDLPFDLASVSLSVGGSASASIELFNRQNFKAEDKKTHDSDGILGVKPKKQGVDTLPPQILFGKDHAWLKYTLDAEAEATLDTPFFDGEASGSLGLSWYRVHDPTENLGKAVADDLLQPPRFALVEEDVRGLRSGDALALQVRGKLGASFSFKWSDFFASNLSALGELVDDEETFAIRVQSSVGATVSASVEDDFVLVFTRAENDRLRVAVRKANKKSLEATFEAKVEVGFDNPGEVKKVVEGVVEGLIGLPLKKVNEVLSLERFVDLSEAQRQLVNTLLKRLKSDLEAVDKLLELKTTLEDLPVKVEKKIKAFANAKLTLAFVYEYGRVETHLALVQATFPEGELHRFHEPLVHRNLAPLLAAVPRAGGQTNEDGVELEKFLNQKTLEIKRSFGFTFGLGPWKAGEKTIDLKREVKREDFSGRIQWSFDGERGYKGNWDKDEWEWRVGFSAAMPELSETTRPMARDFEYSISVVAEFVEGTVSRSEVGRYVDQAVIWGAVSIGKMHAETERLAALLNGKRNVGFSYRLKFGPRAFMDILDELAADNTATFASALGTAMPWSTDYDMQRNPAARKLWYGKLWHWYFEERARKPRALAKAAEALLDRVDEGLALQENQAHS